MMMKNSFYNNEELQNLGLKKIGKNVMISRNTCFYSPEQIELGDNVRIDDFCVLSGNIKIGNYVHIAAFCVLFGSAGIQMNDFSGLSSKVSIYSASDDYLGDFLTGPCIPIEFRKITEGEVTIEKHALVGTGSTILPGVRIAVGSALGAMSLLTNSTLEWQIYAGIPAKPIKERKKNLLELEIKLKNTLK
jgi:galactoside O-acetyltransferase